MVLKHPETISLIVPLLVLNKSMINEQKLNVWYRYKVLKYFTLTCIATYVGPCPNLMVCLSKVGFGRMMSNNTLIQFMFV